MRSVTVAGPWGTKMIPLGGQVNSEFPLIYCIFTWARHGTVWYNGSICWKLFWNQKLSKKLCNCITWEWSRKQNHVNPEVPGLIRDRLFSERVKNVTYIPSHSYQCPNSKYVPTHLPQGLKNNTGLHIKIPLSRFSWKAKEVYNIWKSHI